MVGQTLIVLFDRICIKKNVLLQPAWLSPHVVMNLLGVGNACKNTWYRRPGQRKKYHLFDAYHPKNRSKQWHKWQGGLLYRIDGPTQPGWAMIVEESPGEDESMMTMFQISWKFTTCRGFFWSINLRHLRSAVCWTFGITSMGREIVEHTDTF